MSRLPNAPLKYFKVPNHTHQAKSPLKPLLQPNPDPDPEPEVEICAYCGEPHPDKLKAPIWWPGQAEAQQYPESPYVHQECEELETRLAHENTSQEERDQIISTASLSSR